MRGSPNIQLTSKLEIMMEIVLLFLSGLLCANGIPHFVNGISGKNFHNPSLHRLMPSVPSPLFNVIWGLLNFCLSLFILSFTSGLSFELNLKSFAFGFGFAFAAIGLSILFSKDQDRQTK
jgi:hypothetical protein